MNAFQRIIGFWLITSFFVRAWTYHLPTAIALWHDRPAMSLLGFFLVIVFTLLELWTLFVVVPPFIKWTKGFFNRG